MAWCNISVEDCSDNSVTLRIIGDDFMYYVRIINWFLLVGIINVFGVFSNSVNMAVLYKMGFGENNNINLSLFALAISDFGSCFTTIFLSIAMNPWMRSLDLPFESDELSYILSAWPHVMFSKITTVITAFITFERCLCVCLPLKVKSIITRKRIICFLIICYVLNISLMIPIFYVNGIGEKFYVDLNKTMLGLVFAQEREQIESIVFPIINILLSNFAFIFIIICTILLVVKLKQKSAWRKQATQTSSSTDNKNNDSDKKSKEQRVSKMVAIISTLFIVSFIPTVAMQLTMWLERRVSVDGEFQNLNKVLASFTCIPESINAAINIFIYYKNSSNYKTVFDQMFRSKKK